MNSRARPQWPVAWAVLVALLALMVACSGDAASPGGTAGADGTDQPAAATRLAETGPPPAETGAPPGETGAPAGETPTQASPGQPADGSERAVLVGAGRVGRCGTASQQTAALVEQIEGIVLVLGDNAYDEGTPEQYAQCFEPTWGRFKERTYPIPGNHEYRTPGAAGYFEYFGPRAGNPGEGWYAYEAAGWRIYALNSECPEIGGCDPGSAQYEWIRQELDDNPRDCIMAYWHRPMMASAYHRGAMRMQPIFELLYEAGAELVLTAHDHAYERMAPVDPNGLVDIERGIRQINVGTGSSTLDPYRAPPLEVTEVRDNTSHGVLKLELSEDGYEWEFIPVRADGFTDNGSDTCRSR